MYAFIEICRRQLVALVMNLHSGVCVSLQGAASALGLVWLLSSVEFPQVKLRKKSYSSVAEHMLCLHARKVLGSVPSIIS